MECVGLVLVGLLQDGEVLLVLFVLHLVVVEDASGYTLLAASLHDIVGLRLVSNKSIDRVVVFVGHTELYVCSWHQHVWEPLPLLLLYLHLHLPC